MKTETKTHNHRVISKTLFICFSVLVIFIFHKVDAKPDAQILEFCPNCGEYEYVYLYLNSTSCGNPVLTDEEGWINLSGLSGYVYVAVNSSTFFEKFGFYPDVVGEGKFRLSNSGERLLLYCNGQVLDSISYCDGGVLSYCDRDVVYFRSLGFGSEWDFRYIEWTTFEPVKDYVKGKIIVTPADFRFTANESLVLVSYTLTDPLNLKELDEKGVEVKIVLAGNPVGGIPLEEIKIVSSLRNSEVFFLDSHYFKNFHYKFAIEDRKRVIISTENWRKSNRGYIVIFESEKIANQLLELVSSDLKFSADHGKVSGIEGNGEYVLSSNPIEFEGNVTLYIFPDANFYGNPVFELISNSEKELLIEVPYMSLNWFGTDKTLELIMNACRKSEVKILLDSKHSKKRNTEVVNFLNNIGGECNISAKLIPLRGFNSLHGKMIYSDGKCIVTSANFNEYGLKLNREVAILMEGEACEILRDQFYRDWSDRFSVVSIESPFSALCTLVTFLVVVVWRHRSG